MLYPDTHAFEHLDCTGKLGAWGNTVSYQGRFHMELGLERDSISFPGDVH